MSCVNIKSKQFTELVESTGISAKNLELIIHQYQNIEGNEGKFPSVEYIMSKLTGTNKVTSDAQVELWEKQYSTTKVFKDEQSLNAAKTEATKYFSEEAITTWEDNKGNYVMKVAEPQLIGEALEREYERILANAPRDKEGRLLAPNGKPSNLNERQYAQVRSKAFIRWFGDWINDPENASKIVDENGEPLVVYHGSDSYGFNTFDPLKSDDKLSLFFSDNKGIASTYTKHIPILNTYLRNKLLDNGAITLIESNKWEELTELINSLYGFRPLLDWIHGESDKDYYQSELKETLEHIKNNNLPSQDAKALLDEIWDLQQKNYKKGAYSIKVYAHKGQYDITIIDNYEHENSGHIVEEGIIFKGSKESLIDSIQNETKIYGVYLNIKNPLEVNGTNDEGMTSNWNNLNFVGDDGVRPGIQVSRRDVWGNAIPGTKQFIQRTRDITKYANQKGYDGVIFENISDKGPYYNKYEQLTDQDVLQDTNNDGVDFYDNLKRNRSKVIVAYSPNQIKSAENVGTFETREDNIYHDSLPTSSRDIIDTTLLNLFEANNNKEYATTESEVSIIDLINRIDDSEYSSIIELLKNKFGNRKSGTKLLAGIKVKLINPLNAARGYEDAFIKALNFGGRRAFYNASDKTIYVNVGANYNKGNSSGVLLHEIMHALTVDRILSNPEAKAKFEQILKDYQDSNFDPRYREGADHPLEEFIANIWSDPVTIENLKKIKSSRVNQFLWNEIKEFFSNLFSDIFAGTSSDSLMAEASVEMIKLLESPIIIRSNDKFRESLPVSYYSGNIIPEENTIFVFGSNPEGRHGAGAAKVAREQFGAKYGIGEGLQGNAYALPTKDLRVTANKGLRSISREQIIENIKKLYDVARSMPEKTFKVAYTNGATEVTLNGYSGQEMVEMFLSAGDIPSNVQFSENWKPMLEQGISPSKSNELENNFDDNTETTEEVEEVKQEFFEDTLEAFSKSSQKLTSQINNLLDSNVISATEVRHLAEQAVYWISDHITELQENPDLIVKIYGEGLKDFNVEEATRADIVRAIGPSNIIAMCKEKFSPSEGKYSKRSTNRKARLIIDNWEALMKLASDVFANVEDFAIVGNEINEEINADADNFNDSNNQDDVAETEGDNQEHWQVETRTLDVLSSMSQLVRQALTKCYILETSVDNEGNTTYNKVKSEFGINERVNARDATNSILRWTQGSLTLEDMVSKLQAKADKNPWITQIIERLTDTSGNETDFQSQFFGVFCKHFQSYTVVIKENGEYKSIQVNEFPALREAVSSVTTQYKIGEHPMFTPEGINKKVFQEFKEVYEELVPLRNKLDSADQEEVARLLAYASNTLGYYITPELVKSSLDNKSFRKMIDAMGYMVKSIESNLDNKNYNPFEFKSEGSIGGNLRSFLQPLTDQLEDTAVSSFYDSGKMYQSYITPSYMTKLMNKFRLKGEEFDTFIMKEYGESEWFKLQTGKIETGWRNALLRELVKDENAREIFKHKVQLNFNKHSYMRNMSDTEYILSLLTEYFSETSSAKQARVPAWFRVPMLSNKPSSEFVRFYSERGINYKEVITDGLKMIFDQELSRIQTVKMRNLKKGDQDFIKNFDENGKKFNFLDFMNTYLTGDMKNSELGKLLKAKLEGKELTSEEEVSLNTLAKKAIYEAMDAKAQSVVQQWSNAGILEGAKQISNIGKEDSEVIEKLTNFVWNDTFAAMNIIQLTVTDIAYYKDAEDLQKRLAQIHAPGIRGNVNATDYEGNRVTDGYERTFYLTDFDDFKSNIKENVAIVFDRKIAAANPEEKAGYEALKESILKQFDEINVADAQGYNSPTSYRKKAFVFGKWSKKAEDIYQKLKSGKYTYTDLQVAFQPLKPFVYTQIHKSTNVEGAPITNLDVPIQNKNSEYLLIMADAILQGEDTGRPNLLRAVYEVMEESAKSDNTKGIDTVQFESTVKSGLMGAVDIKQFQYAENGEAKAKAAMRAAIYKNGKDGEYNSSVVHEIPFEDYCLQQEVPPHFKNHEQAHGSQIRFIIPSDLEETNYLGEKVTYNVEGKELTAEEFKIEYEQTIAANIEESINTLSDELHLKGTLKDRNIALSKILQREILSSPRYGVDLLQACSVDEEGNFRIPLGDPIQSKRVEQLINSIIKNRINKQTIAGGPVVQVSNFGTSKELNIRFKDKKGNLLKTRSEFEGTDEAFKEYLKEHQAGIAYFEVFAPIYTNEIFTKFQNPDGSIDMDAIEAIHPDLLKMVGYRIPTEDKYSMAPLKIVGFLPREAGDGIMLPNDITLLTGSDFDVDKEYLMRKDIPIKTRPRKEIFDRMYEKLVNSKEGAKYKDKQMIKENLNMFLDNPQIRRNTDTLYQYMWQLYKREAYVADPPTMGRTYRNNKIVEMTYAVLTHETTADKMLNPGGFEPQKRMGYLVAAYKNPANKYLSWEELETLSTKELKNKCYTDKNLAFIDTHIQFYKQNNAAGALIGMFAVHKVAHAVLESDGYMLNIDNICSLKEPFTIANMEFGGNMVIDAKYDRNGQLIGKTLGSLVASAVDAVKDPVLNLMNINGSTANYLNTLVRMGMPFNDAALFLSQSAITKVLSTYNKENITKYTKLGDVILKRLKELEDSFDINYSSQLNSEPLTKEELIEGIKEDVKPEIEYKVLKALQKVQKIGDALRGPTFATRFNSISSAVGPLIIDNLITEHKMQQFSNNVLGPNGEVVDITDILRKHPVLGQFSRTTSIAKYIFHNMPANSTGFRNILNSMTDEMSNIIYSDRKLLNSLSDFYQSYLMIASGAVKEGQLSNYINGFPTWFFKQNFKEKYKDNKLIQAIKLDINKDTGRAILKVDTTGLDAQQKEVLSSAWIDLHKADPDLSTKLFMYNFFRTGIGFSPKTFMGLVPTYVKERIPGYLETYRTLPSVSAALVLDQFVRNNWDNTRLVPKKTVKYIKQGDRIQIYKEDEIREMSNVPYFRTKDKGRDILWRQVGKTDTAVYYEEVTPLGNNGEYLEISTSNITKAKEIPAIAKEQSKESQISDASNQEIDNEIPVSSKMEDAEITELIYRVLENGTTVTSREQAIAKAEEFKSKSEKDKKALENGMKKFIKNRLEKLSIKYNSDKIDEVYKAMC